MELKNYQQDVLKDLAEYRHGRSKEASARLSLLFGKVVASTLCSQATLPFIHIATR